MNYLMMNEFKEKKFLIVMKIKLILSLFNFNNKWYFSSRSNLLRMS